MAASDEEEISSTGEDIAPNLKRKNASDEKRTCKKAKHPWQIKGSRSDDSSCSSSALPSSSPPQPSSSSLNTAPDNSSDEDSTHESQQTHKDLDEDVLSNVENRVDEEITNAVENLLPQNTIPNTAGNIRRLSYIERWQCQHAAKSTVDNAINKTLEEMGLSPNAADNSRYQEQRSRIENEGVSQAILLQGLQRQRPPMRQWSPIIARLTQVSEMIFSMNMQSRRSVGEAFVRGEPDLLPLVPDENNGWREEPLEEPPAPPVAPVAPNTNFLLDQAVIAAMTEQGLQRQ